MPNHIKETSLNPECLDDVYDENDISVFSIAEDSIFILSCAAGTALLIASILALI